MRWTVAVLGTALGTLPAGAQARMETRLAVSGGQATDAMGVTASALTAAPSVVLRPDPRLAIELGAQGTRFANSQWAATGSGGVGIRVPLGSRLAFTTSASAAWTTTAYDASYTSAIAIPALELGIHRFTAFAGAQFAHGGSTFTTQDAQSPIPIGSGSRTQVVSTSRSLHGVVYGAGVRFARGEGIGHVGYREERARVGTLRFADRAVTLDVTSGRVAYGASIGTRSGIAGEEAMFGSGSVILSVSDALALQLAGARYPSNHLTGAVAGNAISIGIVVRSPRVRPAAERRVPKLEGVAAPPRGVQRLVIDAPRAKRVEVAADWTRWKPVVATRAPGGQWYVDVRLAPGRYRYAFRLDGNRWAVPEGEPSVDDGFGGRSAWLTVK